MRISDWSSDVCSSDLRGVEIGIECPGQRQRLDEPVIETARHITHQRAQPPAMIDQPAQIPPRPRAAGRFQQQRVDSGVDEIIFERGVVLKVHHAPPLRDRSEEHTSELQSLMRISYAVFCLKKKKNHNTNNQ